MKINNAWIKIMDSNPRQNWNPDKANYIHKTYYDGIPRARTY